MNSMKLDNLLESLVKLDEGASVNSELDTLLKQNGYGDTAEVDNKMLRQALIQAVNALPVVWQSPNGQNSRTGKDALAIMAWFLSQWDGNRSTIQHTFEEVADLVAIKNSLKTTKGKWLADVQNKYKTVPEFRSFIQREQRNKNNTVEDVNVEGYDYPNPFYSDKDVDVYKASTINDAIKYSKGYTFCIGRRDGSNLFYGYRIAANAPESTVYFCWFKDAEGNKTHDDMCVIHVANNGMYRMTDARNSNGSPVVDKDTVLREYPKLEKALQKMYSEPLDDEEKVVSKVKPFTVIELNDTTRAYTPKQIAMLIGNACRFGDDFFNYVYEEMDGKDLENGDSLIRKYLATGANRPTEEQEETLVQDGWGEYVDYNFKQYKKQIDEAQAHILAKLKEYNLYVDDGIEYYRSKDTITLYQPLDKPVFSGNEVRLSGDLWTEEQIQNIRVRTPFLVITDCNRIHDIGDITNIKGVVNGIMFARLPGLRDVHVKASHNSITLAENPNITSVTVEWEKGLDIGKEFEVADSPKMIHFKAQFTDDLIFDNVGITDLADVDVEADKLNIRNCDKLRSLGGIGDIFPAGKSSVHGRNIWLKNCPNLEDVSALGAINNGSPRNIQFIDLYVTECPKISEEDWKTYITGKTERYLLWSKETETADFCHLNHVDTDYFKDCLKTVSIGGKDVRICELNRSYAYSTYYRTSILYPLYIKGNVEVKEQGAWDFSGLKKVSSLFIRNNRVMYDLTPLKHTKIEDELKLKDCVGLLTTAGCPKVKNLEIQACLNLREVELPKTGILRFTFANMYMVPMRGGHVKELYLDFIQELDSSFLPSCDLLEIGYIQNKTPQPFANFPEGVKRVEFHGLYHIPTLEGIKADSIKIDSWNGFDIPVNDFIAQLEANNGYLIKRIRFDNLPYSRDNNDNGYAKLRDYLQTNVPWNR